MPTLPFSKTLNKAEVEETLKMGAALAPITSVVISVTPLTTNPLETLRLPAKDAEPVPAKVGLPVLIVREVPTRAAALIPLVTYSEPAKDDEPVPANVASPAVASVR